MILDKITKEYVDKVFLDEKEYLGNNKKVNMIVPKVSVWVITYNQEKYISECLDSILMQEVDFDYEIVIGEDGSSDNTGEICKKYAEKYPDKIRLFSRNRENSAIYDRNGKFKRSINGFLTFKSCRANYIALCEGDDIWLDKHKIYNQVNMFNEKTDASLIFTACVIKDLRFNISRTVRPFLTDCIVGSKQFILGNVFSTTASLMFKRNVIKDFVNNELIFNKSNTDSLLKILSFKYGNIYYMNRVTAQYNRFTPNSWSDSTKALTTSYKNSIRYCNFIEANDIISYQDISIRRLKCKNSIYYSAALDTDLFRGIFIVIFKIRGESLRYLVHLFLNRFLSVAVKLLKSIKIY